MGWRKGTTRLVTVAFAVWLGLSAIGAAARGSAEAIKALGLVEPPQPRAVPEFTLPALGGGSIAMNDFRGKTVLVNFWTTWCPPCKWEMPILDAFYRDYKDRGFVVLAISLDKTEDVVRKFVTEKRLTFPIALDPESVVAAKFGVMGLPGTFIVGPDGYIKASGYGPREWDGPDARALIVSLLPVR